jgi:integrase
MSRPASRTPSYRLHRPSGQAVVTLSGKDYYLGPYGTEASKAEYDRLVGLWQAGGRTPLHAAKGALSIAELMLAYWGFAQTYYVKAGQPTSQVKLIKRALGPLRELYGHRPVSDFSPLALKAVRQRFIDDKLSRGVINAHVDRIRLMFRWGVENELVPESVYSALKAVRCLARGRTEAKDHPPVGPVAEEHVMAVLAVARTVVRDMIEVQYLSGMRPSEVIAIRASDIDRSGDVWVYRVAEDVNKTEHHGKARTVLIGPRAQAVLAPYLERFPDGHLFRPRGWACRRRGPRKTARRVSACFAYNTFYQAVRDACRKAGVPPFRPNALRHSAATRFRRDGGIDTAKTILGHGDIKTTEIYAQRDLERARSLVAKIG